MAEKLTEQEYKELKKYESRCYDMMHHAETSVRILNILLSNYKENQSKQKGEIQ